MGIFCQVLTIKSLDTQIYTLERHQRSQQLPKMDIQIFENFALHPIQGSDQPPKRHKMKEEEIKQGVKVLVKHYQLDETQKKNLEYVAELTKYVPNVNEVEWVATEARLREGCTQDLNIWMFAYMEYFPWYLRSKDEDHRLWAGALKRYNGLTWYLWIDFPSSQHSPDVQEYLNSPQGADKPKHEYYPQAWARNFVTWHTPFDVLFKLDDMMPDDRFDETKNEDARALQNAYLKATMKILARFPGLIVELDPSDKSKTYQLHGGWSEWPFLHREKFSESNPLAKLFDMLCTKKMKTVNQAK